MYAKKFKVLDPENFLWFKPINLPDVLDTSHDESYCYSDTYVTRV